MSERTRAGESGQAAVELVAMLPVMAAVGLAVAQLLAAGVAREQAEHASHAGAIAILERLGDPAAAARAAVPRASRARMTVVVDRRTVKVTLRPAGPLPGLAAMLTARSEASAGT